MEKRKIMKFGNTSHGVTMPNDWIKENNLKKGDDVNLSVNNNVVKICLPKGEKVEKRIEINIDNVPLKLFNKMLISYYLKNYKYIKITGKKAIERLEEIRIFKEKLSSIEIFEIGSDFIVLKDLSTPQELDVNDLINKIVDMVRTLFDEAMEGNRLSFMSQIDSNINKLTFLTFKTINYNLENDLDFYISKNSIHLWRIISSLEKVGDDVKRVARYLRRGDDEECHFIKMLFESVRDYFVFINNFQQKDIEFENNLKLYLDRKQSLLKDIENNREKFTNNPNLYLLVTQFFKNIIGDLDVILISIMDMNS